MVKVHYDRMISEIENERDVLLSFESICVASLWRTAWMFHERGEHGSAPYAWWSAVRCRTR